MKEFCVNKLKVKQPRDDYKEFLELAIGGNISRERKFADKIKSN